MSTETEHEPVYVDDRPLDYGPDWRSGLGIEYEEWLQRVHAKGLTMFTHDYGVSTMIGWEDVRGNRDQRVKKLAAAIVSAQSRARRLGYREDWKKQYYWRLSRALEILRSLCIEHGIWSTKRYVCETAARFLRYLCKQSSTTSKWCTRHRIRRAVRILLMLAFYNNGELVPPGLRSTADYRVAMHLAYRIFRGSGRFTGPGTVERVKTYIRLLAESPREEYLSMRLFISCWKTRKTRVQGMAPRSLASGVVYVVARLLGRDVSLARIGSKAGVTETATRSAIKKMGIRVHYILEENGEEKLVEEWQTGKGRLSNKGVLSPEAFFRDLVDTGCKRVEIQLGEPCTLRAICHT